MKRFSHKRLIIGTLLVLLGGAGAYLIFGDPLLAEDEVLVTRVIDGDTIVVDGLPRGDSRGELVRLSGINAPDKDECYFNRSTEYLTNLIEGKTVRLQKDVTGMDNFGRLIRYVILPSGHEKDDDILVNDALIRQGYAFSVSSPPDNRYNRLFPAAEQEAKRENRGMWAACNYEKQDDPRRQQHTPPPNPDCTIKGNISEQGFGLTYFVPGCNNYDRVQVDTRRGERYFCTEQEAIDAGFHRATDCPAD